MTKEFIKKCKKCGSDDFDINEFIVYRATVNKDSGELSAYKIKNNGTEMIVCVECGEEYCAADFKSVSFLEE